MEAGHCSGHLDGGVVPRVGVPPQRRADLGQGLAIGVTAGGVDHVASQQAGYIKLNKLDSNLK